MSIRLETLTMPAANMGGLNPMPDIKNVSYIHAGYEMTSKILEEEKTYIGKNCVIENAIIDIEVYISDGKQIIGTKKEPIVVQKGSKI